MSKTNFEFKRCYPDANEFKDVIKVKSLDDWGIEYIQLSDTIGYWMAENPFYGNGFELYKQLVSNFPVVKDTNKPNCTDANPFASIHLPEWCCIDVFLLMKSYFDRIFPSYMHMQFSEWGNLYFKDEARPYDYFRLPHCDGPNGVVSNLWFTDHPEDESGTILYQYHGKIIKGPDKKLYFDYQCDKDHPLFEECKNLSLNKKRLEHWNPLTIEEEEYWGFERLGIAPSKNGMMTLYNTEVPHSPFISTQCEFRWSHAYSINYEPFL